MLFPPPRSWSLVRPAHPPPSPAVTVVTASGESRPARPFPARWQHGPCLEDGKADAAWEVQPLWAQPGSPAPSRESGPHRPAGPCHRLEPRVGQRLRWGRRDAAAALPRTLCSRVLVKGDRAVRLGLCLFRGEAVVLQSRGAGEGSAAAGRRPGWVGGGGGVISRALDTKALRFGTWSLLPRRGVPVAEHPGLLEPGAVTWLACALQAQEIRGGLHSPPAGLPPERRAGWAAGTGTKRRVRREDTGCAGPAGTVSSFGSMPSSSFWGALLSLRAL